MYTDEKVIIVKLVSTPTLQKSFLVPLIVLPFLQHPTQTTTSLLCFTGFPDFYIELLCLASVTQHNHFGISPCSYLSIVPSFLLPLVFHRIRDNTIHPPDPEHLDCFQCLALTHKTAGSCIWAFVWIVLFSWVEIKE